MASGRNRFHQSSRFAPGGVYSVRQTNPQRGMAKESQKYQKNSNNEHGTERPTCIQDQCGQSTKQMRPDYDCFTNSCFATAFSTVSSS